MSESSDIQAFRDSGFAYLARFPASTQRFRAVLRRKLVRMCVARPDSSLARDIAQDPEYSARLVGSLVQECSVRGLLDDFTYAHALAVSLRGRGFGWRALCAKLAEKGLDSDTIARALSVLREKEQIGISGSMEDPEVLSALRLARRRTLGPFDPQGKTPPAKAMGIFARAGFDFRTAKHVLEMSAAEAYRSCPPS